MDKPLSNGEWFVDNLWNHVDWFRTASFPEIRGECGPIALLSVSQSYTIEALGPAGVS